jgi:hypothetical protein
MKSVSASNYPARADLLTANGYTGNRNNSNTIRWNAITSVDLGGTIYQACVYWDGEGDLIIATRVLDGSWTAYDTGVNITGDDNHDVCSIGIDPNGFIHCVYDLHAEALKYAKSNAAIDTWTGILTTGLSMLGTNETSATYPTFLNDPAGNLYFIFRDGTSGNGDLYLYKYTHGTTTWAAAAGTTAGKVINGKTSSVNPYWEHPCFDSDFGSGGYLHLSWHWRSEASGPGENHDRCYVKWDGTNWVKADGSSQTIPITEANAEVVDDVAPNVGMTSFNSLYSDSAGNPHIVYPKTNTNRYIYHAYHNGTNWTVSQITNTLNLSLGDNSTYDIGLTPAIAIDRDNNTVYVIYRDLFESAGAWVLKSTNFTTWTKTRIYPYSVGWWSPKFDYVEFERSGNLYIPIEEYFGPILAGSQSTFPIYVWKVDPSIW